MFKKKAELVNVDQGLAQPSIETEDFAARFDEEGNWIIDAHESKLRLEVERLRTENAVLVQELNKYKQRCTIVESSYEGEKTAHALTKDELARLRQLNAGNADIASQLHEKDVALQRLKAQLAEAQKRIDEYAFKHKVLLAMVTISENEYVGLCNEMKMPPKDVNFGYGTARA